MQARLDVRDVIRYTIHGEKASVAVSTSVLKGLLRHGVEADAPFPDSRGAH